MSEVEIKESRLNSANKVKLIGMIFFAVGIIVTIAASAKVPAKDMMFPDTFIWYLIGTIISVVGLVIWHIKQRETVKLDLTSHQESSEANPDVLLRDTVTALRELNDKKDIENANKFIEVIDDILDNFVLPFAEIRHHLIDMFGMSEGSEILVILAYGERNLNRVWSAAADGHLEEARTVLPDVLKTYEEALELYNRKAQSL